MRYQWFRLIKGYKPGVDYAVCLHCCYRTRMHTGKYLKSEETSSYTFHFSSAWVQLCPQFFQVWSKFNKTSKEWFSSIPVLGEKVLEPGWVRLSSPLSLLRSEH